MPTYSVQVTVNVPSVGSRVFTSLNIAALTPEEAMVKAKADIQVRVTALQETAP